MGAIPFRIALPAGLATTIGALPQLNAIEAARIMRHWLPGLPAGPTIDTSATASGGPTRSASGGADDLENVRSFLESLKGRLDPIVLSLTGPVTIDLRLMQGGMQRVPAASRALELVTRQARLMIDLADQLLPGAPVMLFLEEPGLANSMLPTFPLAPTEISDLVRGVVEPLSGDAMIGVQVDGRADWGLLLRTGISVLGAPVTARLETAAAELGRFLEAGGFIAWGAVPVNEPLGSGVDRLWKRLSALWAELAQAGLDPLLLRERSIITPAASLGEFGVSQAERVMKLTAELSERVFNQVVGARLSIGA